MVLHMKNMRQKTKLPTGIILSVIVAYAVKFFQLSRIYRQIEFIVIPSVIVAHAMKFFQFSRIFNPSVTPSMILKKIFF
jgi:hypothetical protein